MYGQCCHDHDLKAEIPADAGIRLDKITEKVLRKILKKKLKGGEVDIEQYVERAKILWEGVEKGYGKKLKNTLYRSADEQMLLQLRRNVHVFSAFANHHMNVQLVQQMVDANGKVRTFAEFKKAVAPIVQNYNVNYLRSEYQTAYASAQMARKWQKIQERKEVLPYLRYVTVNDGKVREEHRAMHGAIYKVDSPFWDRYYPPNGWNCRCTVIQIKADAEKPPESIPVIPESFTHNVGKTGKIFDRTHPYFEVLKKYSKQAEQAFNMPLPYDPKDIETVFAKDSMKNLLHETKKKYKQVYPQLSPEEKAVLRDYTGLGYLINDKLIKAETLSAYEISFKRILNGALNKLPDFEGPVFRGVNLKEEAIKRYRDAIGEEITEEFFISTSYEGKKAFDKAVRFEIYSHTGKKIEEISKFTEAEVLFKTQTRFIVLDVNEVGSKTVIVLEEVKIDTP